MAVKELSHCKILVVDDTEANLDILVDALGDLYDLSVAMDGETALEAVEEEKPDLILLDIMMPGMDGYEVLSTLKQNPRFQKIPIIFLTALTEIENKTRGFQLGAVDYITKPFEVLEVQARVKTHLSLVLASQELEQQNQILEQKVLERTRELAQTQDVTIHSLASLAETRDNETGGHILRTQHYVKLLSQHLAQKKIYKDQLDKTTIDLFFKSAPLHDIGKVGVPDAILLKPGKLTDQEFEIMKNHARLGYEALLKAEEAFEMQGKPSFLRHARDIALTHHEKWNGRGYPQGLSETDIPLSGRLMAVADVYDALISKRVYKAAFSHKEAVEIIAQGKGEHFDPELVDAFLALSAEFQRIKQKFADHHYENPQTPLTS
jgi:putative two-component system response regulator